MDASERGPRSSRGAIDLSVLDPTSVRAFWAVSETLHFTKGAKLAGMTQSGVSSHIAKLERELGTELFSRSNRTVKLTSAGELLRRFVLEVNQQCEVLREELLTDRIHLVGEVRYAMPPSCMLSPHFPLLLAHRAKHFPDITLDVHVCDNREVLARLVAEEVHFGFVTVESRSSSVRCEPYCVEEYVLVGREPRSVDGESLREVPVVRYPGAADVFHVWVTERYPNARIRLSDLPAAAMINDLSGVRQLLAAGVGWAFVARHCVRDELASGRLVVSGGAPVPNQVYLATRSGGRLPARARAVMSAFGAILDAKG